jgi:hypothetical protein
MPEKKIPLIRTGGETHLWINLGIHASRKLKVRAAAGVVLLAGAVWIANNDGSQNVIVSPPPVPHESPSGVFQPGRHVLKVPDSDEITYGGTVFSQLRNKNQERISAWQVDGQYPFVVVNIGVTFTNPDLKGSTCKLELENAGVSPSPTDPPVMRCTPGAAKEKSLFVHHGAKQPPNVRLASMTRYTAPQRPRTFHTKRV